MVSIKKLGVIGILAAALLTGPLPGIKGSITPAKPLDFIVLAVPSAHAMEYKEEGWSVPDMTGYTKVKEFFVDASDKVLGDETLVEMWKNDKKEKIYRYFYKGRNWGYGVVNESERYSIRDNDCNGVFEEKYRADEQFYLSECAI